MIHLNLVSIQIGLPQTYGDPNKKTFAEKQWATGFFKLAVDTPVNATATGIEGDGQADLKVHGGPDKAVCVYPHDHFSFWNTFYGIQMNSGAFGENFTTRGAVETQVCIGDRYSVSGTVFEVSQPRQLCWKLARRWGLKGLPVRVQESGRTGWYFRVLVEGDVEAPSRLQLIDRPNERWTIARCNQIMRLEKSNLEAAHQLSQVKELSESWRKSLTTRASKNDMPTDDLRLNSETSV